jgi:hypothetical protein
MEARTPHQFAQELFDKYDNILYKEYNNLEAKKCALIAVDYMESVLLGYCQAADVNEGCRSSYLLSVREEIEKL